MRPVLVGCAVLAFGLPVAVGAETWALDDAVARALSENAKMSVRAAELAAARAEAEAAGRPEPLTLSLSPTTIWAQFEAAISSVLDISGRRKWASRAARHEVAATVAGNEEFALELTAAVRSSYWQLRVAHDRVALAERQRDVAQAVHSSAQRLAEAGVGLGIDRDRAANEARQADLELATSRADLRATQTELAGLLYLPAETEIQAVDTTPPQTAARHEGLQEIALASRPAARGARAMAQAAMARARIASAEGLPDLGMAVEREEGVNFGRALLELPLIDFGKIKHGKRAARSRAEAALAEIRVVEAEICEEVQAAVDDLASASAAETRLHEQLIPAQQDILARLQRGYISRTVAYPTVLEAQQALQDLEAQGLDATLDRLYAEVRLDRALGLRLEEIDDARDAE